MEYSKTFCPYPWISIMTQPTGTVSWCCVARDNFKQDDGTMVDLNRGHKIEDVWNSNHMRKIRKQMIEGDVVKGCEHCYDLEDMGFPSYRTNYIRDWFEYSGKGEEIQDIIERSIDNDYMVPDAPMYLDFRLGNMCNLKCRMCQPQNSSQIQKEYKKIEAADPSGAQFIKDNFTWGQFVDNLTNWEDDPNFLRQVEEWLPGVVKLYFTGGEPTIIERVYWIMEKCVEMGIANAFTDYDTAVSRGQFFIWAANAIDAEDVVVEDDLLCETHPNIVSDVWKCFSHQSVCDDNLENLSIKYFFGSDDLFQLIILLETVIVTSRTHSILLSK